MAKLVKVFDPTETTRRLHLILEEDVCPGFLEFLATVPYRAESTLIRAIAYQWFLTHQAAGDLHGAVEEALSGLGGKIDVVVGMPKRVAKEVPIKRRPRAAKSSAPGGSAPSPSPKPQVSPEHHQPPSSPPAEPPTAPSDLPPLVTVAQPPIVSTEQQGAADSPPEKSTAPIFSPAQVSAEALAALSSIEAMF